MVYVTDLPGYVLETLRVGREFALYRGRPVGEAAPVLVLAPLRAPQTTAELHQLEHEYSLANDLQSDWAVRPLAIARRNGASMIVLEDAGGDLLEGMLARPLELTRFLPIAVALAAALRQVHQHGLVHRDIRPANVFVDADANVHLTGFGMASRLPRECQAPTPPDIVRAAFAYMSPEQTGRMNRSIDARSDLYSLGVTLYEMITGSLPFSASDPMEWIHCHIARPAAPPSERAPGIPGPVEAIIVKLLAKAAEDRYQTAAGLEADLRACLTDWQAHRRIDPFPLGLRDISNRLLIPEKLYGREAEIATLVAAFDRVVTDGKAEFVLVSGYAGAGKSAVVNELHKLLVPPRGLFAAGKFDQYKRDIPYATLAQAFQSLVRRILGRDDADLSRWRDALLEALGPNGQLMVNLVPELAAIIGEQPPIPDLPPQEEQNRFQMVFRRFLGVFARPEHPLALFLDDLQWLDVATLELLESLVPDQGVGHLLLIGAYRDNEVGPSHPLMRTLRQVRNAGASVQEIVLTPLRPTDVGRLVADALHREPERVRPLAEMVFEKTAGNAFFLIQFIAVLVEEGLIAFDSDASGWRWEIDRIRAKGFTDNVADLMAAKLSRLPETTQEALGLLACLGNVAEIATLDLVSGTAKDAVHTALWQAVLAGLLNRLDSAYAFVHDRVREAAYANIPEEQRAEVHLRVARSLVHALSEDQLAEQIFEIVNQFNRGAALIHAPEERRQVAKFNLMAGKRARRSAAYASALEYFVAGDALILEDGWARQYRLTFDLQLERAECELVIGDLAAAEKRLAALSGRAANLVDSAAVACLRITLYTTLDRSDLAAEIALEYLRRVGIRWPRRPTEEAMRREYARLLHRLGDRPIEALIDLPVTRNPKWRATLDVLTLAVPAANFTDENLFCLAVAGMANLSLEHGNSDASCHAYVWVGMILRSHFAQFQAGFRFGRLGIDLVEKRGLDRFKARIYSDFGHLINPWTRHLRDGVDWVRRAVATAQANGDLTFASFACNSLTMLLLACGEPLGEVQRETESGLEFTRKVHFGLVADIMTAQLGLVRALRGLTADISSFGDEHFDEGRFQQHLEADPRLRFAECWYWIRKLQARFHANDDVGAVAAADRAQSLLWKSSPFFEAAEYHFYAALARAAVCDRAPADEQAQLRDALASHHRQLEVWAENCPENFANRAALVGAEIARLEGRKLDAESLYEEAIRSAREHGFVHNQGLASELAARFYAARGFEMTADAYLRNARHCYRLWGADGKIRQLEQLHPRLREDSARAAGAVGGALDQVDVGAIIKASQALSGEIVLDRLIETLMRIAIEHAGAERGLLILLRGEALQIEAEARTNEKRIEVTVRREAVTPAALPESILHTVARMRQSVILDDASADNPFAADDYIRRKRARSILCVPLVKQASLVGVLYLENNLASHVFTPSRTSLLELLASQAAISLDNARLYDELTMSEERWRNLFECAPVGVTLVGSDRRYVAANPAFQRMMGYTEEELRQLTPVEITHEDDQAVAKAVMAAQVRGEPYPQHREKRFVRKDGGVVWVEIDAFMSPIAGSAPLRAGVTVDITERKRAEEELRDVQAELAHAARLMTLGEFTASIAHEINQPLAAIASNSMAGLNWLNRKEPDLGETQSALSRIVRDVGRAADVIRGLRALVRKSGPQLTSVDIDEVIGEVLMLTRSEIRRQGVVLHTALAAGDQPVLGDRVQLQQVLLNLITNGLEAMKTITERTSELTVSSRLDGPGNVLVAVEDTGAGLDPAVGQRIFEPFFTTKPDGVGMGLAICRSIVEAHGGRLSTSPRMPQGTAFHFTLPAAPLDLTTAQS